MRVLDLDLDAFLEEPVFRFPEGDRVEPGRTTPWDESKLRTFLEERCRLDRESPTTGTTVERHDKAFFAWRDQIQDGTLQAPFEVVHVDAHSDLGWGPRGWRHLLSEHLRLPQEDRCDPHVGDDGLHYGNYLAYAVSCGWISRLTWVFHPHKRAEDFRILFRDFDHESGPLELPQCDPDQLEEWIGDRSQGLSDETIGVIRRDPPVPFRMEPLDEFSSAEGFDFATLCLSPEFTPKASDPLIEVIEEYISGI